MVDSKRPLRNDSFAMSEGESNDVASDKGLLNSNRALTILSRFALCGCVVTLLFAFSQATDAASYTRLAGVALMSAFGSAAAGGLLGFIFGVPFTKDQVNGGATADGADSPGNVNPTLQYRPNTSLEQISDWLAKMIVGIGLVEIKVIPFEIRDAARFVARGMGDSPAALAYAFATLVFFVICGFLFGFLWARFNLRRLFSDADKDLVDKVSRYDIDGRAFSLARTRLSGQGQEISQDELTAAVAKASVDMQALIYNAALRAASATEGDQYDVKDGVVSVLRSVVAADKRGRNFEAHAELGYALGRLIPPALEEGRLELSKAITMRDGLGKRGWKYYEFRRAYYAIRLHLPPADIIPDLQAASQEPDKFPKWVSSHREVKEWVSANSPSLVK